MKDLFLAISDRLQSKVPALRWIDLDKGQTDGDGPGIDFPAALIDIAYPSCEDTDPDTQLCAVMVTVRVVFEAVADETSHVTPSVWRNRSLSMLDTVEAVVGALQGWEPDMAAPLSRSSQTTERRGDGLKVYTLTFRTVFAEEF